MTISLRKLVKLASCLQLTPDLILLEENAIDFDEIENIGILRTITESNPTMIIHLRTLNLIDVLDQIVIVENGQTIESGHPKELLRNKETVFYKKVMMIEHELVERIALT